MTTAANRCSCYGSRRDVHAALVASVVSVWPNDTVIGSWSRCEFHLAARRAESYSDVDLVAEIPFQETHELVVDGLHHTLRVSRQPYDFREHLTIDDARLLAALLLVNVPPSKARYVRSKVSLLLLRESLRETNRDVACRLATPEVVAALETKLGFRDEAPGSATMAMLRDLLMAYPWGLSALSAFRGNLGTSGVDELREAAWNVSSVPASFIQHLIVRVGL